MAITPKSEDKYVEKCSTAQSFIFPKWHSFKIGTLANEMSLGMYRCVYFYFLECLIHGKETRTLLHAAIFGCILHGAGWKLVSTWQIQNKRLKNWRTSQIWFDQTWHEYSWQCHRWFIFPLPKRIRLHVKKVIFQAFWKLHCCTKSLFFELETSNCGYLLIFWFPLTVQSFSKIGQHWY